MVINRIRDADLTAFFYCTSSAAEPERAKPSEIMSTLLRQLVSSKLDLSVKESIMQEYEACKKKAEEECSTLERLKIKDCIRLILKMINVETMILIIDAVDEIENTPRHELLAALNYIICEFKNVVKIFISSRDNDDTVSTLY